MRSALTGTGPDVAGTRVPSPFSTAVSALSQSARVGRGSVGFLLSTRRDRTRTHAQSISEASAELRVVVADKHIWRAAHGGVPGLLRAPFVGRRIRDRGVNDLSAAEVEEEEHENLAEPDVVVWTKSHAHVTWLRRNVDQPWPSPRGLEPRMYRWTVRLQTRTPSFSNSPRMRSAPQRGLRAAISRISAALPVGGRPDCRERRRQNARNRA